MKKIEMEGALSRAIDQAPLLDFETLSAIPVEKMTGHDWITVQKKRSHINLKPISAIAASFLVGAVVYSGWFAQFKMADSVIALDVNQSVEIITNRQNKVLSVRPLNELGEKVLAGKDFNQADLNESVNVIVTGLIEYGYLNESDKTILVSVKNSDVAKAGQLAADVSQTIEKTAEEKAVSPTILNQTYDKTDADEETLAASLNVTTGKMNVINVINQADQSLELESLAAMSMDQLIKISDEKAIDLSTVIKTEETDATKVKNSLDSNKQVLENSGETTVPLPEAVTEEELAETLPEEVVVTLPADQAETAETGLEMAEPEADQTTKETQDEPADKSKQSVDQESQQTTQPEQEGGKTKQSLDQEAQPDEEAEPDQETALPESDSLDQSDAAI